MVAHLKYRDGHLVYNSAGHLAYDCSCGLCDGGSPAVLHVAFTGITANGCANCTDLNDPAGFALDVTSNKCRWVYNFDPQPCSGAGGVASIMAQVVDLGGGNYELEVVVTDAADGAGNWILHWYKTYSGKPDCNSFNVTTWDSVGKHVSSQCENSGATCALAA